MAMLTRRAAMAGLGGGLGWRCAGWGLAGGCQEMLERIDPSDPRLTEPSTPFTADVHSHVFNAVDVQTRLFFARPAAGAAGKPGLRATVDGAFAFVMRDFQFRYVNVHDYLVEYSSGPRRKIDLMVTTHIDRAFLGSLPATRCGRGLPACRRIPKAFLQCGGLESANAMSRLWQTFTLSRVRGEMK